MKTTMRNTINFIRNNQRILAASLVMASLASCTKNTIEPVAETQYDESTLNAKVSARVATNLVWADDLEGSTFFSTGMSRQTATTYGITTVTNPVYQGTKAARFELRDTDAKSNSGTRAEISFPDNTNLNRWYSYALYAPADGFKYDTDDDVITQWHQGGSLTPALCLRVKQDKLYVRVLSTWIELGAFDKDQWHAYVLHVKHSSSADGLIEIWKDGVKIMNRLGANMYKIEGDLHVPNVKMGIYKSGWNGETKTGSSLRVLLFDDIKIGNENATYADMVPVKNGSATTTPVKPTAPSTGSDNSTTPLPSVTTPTTTMSVTDFKLVNAETEKDVMSITNGATISLSKLAVAKANIRAVVSSDVKSVKFELSGKQSKTTTDAAAPFALHGDDGKGNFFYGNWAPIPTGTYTLKVTPYNGTTAGAAKTITFTVVK